MQYTCGIFDSVYTDIMLKHVTHDWCYVIGQQHWERLCYTRSTLPGDDAVHAWAVFIKNSTTGIMLSLVYYLQHKSSFGQAWMPLLSEVLWFDSNDFI